MIRRIVWTIVGLLIGLVVFGKMHLSIFELGLALTGSAGAGYLFVVLDEKYSKD